MNGRMARRLRADSVIISKNIKEPTAVKKIYRRLKSLYAKKAV